MSKVCALEMRGVTREFPSGAERLRVLRGVELRVEPGEIVALVAPSGTGKSTLLHIAGLLDSPQEGEVWVSGERAEGLGDVARSRIRRDAIGFVYQFHHLLAEFTALENIVLPQLIAGASRLNAEARARALLGRFALEHRCASLPGQLSGGEQQRVAIARALANQPKLLLADEPTGNLDSVTSLKVFDELLHVVRSEGAGALIATHNDALARKMDRVLALREGKLVAI